MTESQEINSGSGVVRENFRFDEARLAAWMRENVDGFTGDLRVEQFKGGQSNPTYKLITKGGTYVLRRKPPGEIAKSAHAVDREARIQKALAGTDVPVSHIHGLCVDTDVIGSWFYVMDFVEGRIIWDATFPDVATSERPAYFDEMNRIIAALHSLKPAAVGLADYGRAGNYFERQIARFTRQYRADAIAGTDPHLDRLIEWLIENIPIDDSVSIAHGDFRVDNMIFHPTEPRVLAVLDWELSTIGHPIADFAYHAMMYRMPPIMIAGLEGHDLAALNVPSEAEYVARYCARTGRKELPSLSFYYAFNMFRLAAIVHGIKARAIRGTSSSEHSEKLVRSLPFLAQRAWEIAHQQQ